MIQEALEEAGIDSIQRVQMVNRGKPGRLSSAGMASVFVPDNSTANRVVQVMHGKQLLERKICCSLTKFES